MSKNIFGNTLNVVIDNTGLDMIYSTVQATTLTADANLYVNDNDIMVLLDGLEANKQDVINGETDLTVKSLNIDNTSGTNTLYFDSGLQASIVGTSSLLTFNIAGIEKFSLNATTAAFGSTNITADTGTITSFNCTTSTASGQIRSTGGNVRGDSMTCDNTLTTDFLTVNSDIDADNATFTGDISCRDMTSTRNTNATNLNVTGNCDITGTRNTTEANAGIYPGYILADTFSLNMVSSALTGSSINFTKPSTAHLGSIAYDNVNNIMGFVINSIEQMTLNGSVIDLKQNNLLLSGNIISTGDVACNTPGKLASFHDVQIDGTLTVDEDIIIGSTNVLTEINTKQDTLSTSSNIDVNTVITKGLQVDATNSAGIELISNTINNIGYIDFSYGDPANDYHGRFSYNFNDDMFKFDTLSPTTTPLTIAHNEIVSSVPIVSTSDITCNEIYTLDDINFVNPATSLAEASINYDFVEESMNFYTVGNFTTPRMKMSASLIDFDDTDVTTQGDMTCVDLTTSGDVNMLTGDVTVDNLICNNATTMTDDLNVSGGNCTISGSLSVDTNTFRVDNVNNHVSIGTAASESALLINGARSSAGSLGIHLGYASGTDFYGMDFIVPASTGKSQIDFSTPGVDRRGRIYYQQAGEQMGFLTANVTRLTIEDTTIDAQNCDITTTGSITCNNLTVDTNLLVTDSVNNRLGINCIPSSALSVQGIRNNFPTQSGIHMGSNSSGNDFGIEISNPSGQNGLIDFTTNDGSDWKTRLIYIDTSSVFQIATKDDKIQLDSGTANIELNGNVVVESGKTFSGDIAACRGQLTTYLGEENSTLNVGSFDVNWGNGGGSFSNFGALVPFQCRLKRFCYCSNNNIGSAFTTSTRVVFRAWVNGAKAPIWARCDFSDTTNGNVAARRYSGAFSSSATEQIDSEFDCTVSYGQSIAWETETLTAFNTNNTRHRFSFVVESLEDL